LDLGAVSGVLPRVAGEGLATCFIAVATAYAVVLGAAGEMVFIDPS
jgi:hypothetical protein